MPVALSKRNKGTKPNAFRLAKACPHYNLHPIRTNEIRILVLLPASDKKAPLECILVTCSLDGHEAQYEALSYTWGPPIEGWDFPDERIKLCDRHVTVKANLADALRQFRHPRRCRRLWVDAVCINQDDFEERAQQVSIMSEIYATASRTLIWLGRDDGSGSGGIAIAFCKAVKSAVLADPQSHSRYLDNQSSLEGIFIDRVQNLNGPQKRLRSLLLRVRDAKLDRHPTMEHLKQHVWPALATFTQRRYFKRRWVLQELFNAQSATVYCGASSIGWDALERAFERLTQMNLEHIPVNAYPEFHLPAFSIHYGNASARSLRPDTLWSNRSSGRSLLERLVSFRKAECSYTRDRVYSLLGFGQGRVIVDVDYSIEATTLWKIVAKELVKQGYSPWAIELSANQAKLPTRAHIELPSWVPDLGLPFTMQYGNWFQPENRTASIDDTVRLRVKASYFGTVVYDNGRAILVSPGEVSKDVIERLQGLPSRSSRAYEGDFVVSATLKKQLRFVTFSPLDRDAGSDANENGTLCKVVGSAILSRYKDIGEGEERWYCLV